MFQIPEVVPYEQRARSFGAVAEHYERFRPGPPVKAVDWVIPKDCESAVDLGAGTGALTRMLVERTTEVFAVEPDSRMRTVLKDQVPAAQVIGGVGEAIPLRSERFDLVTAASSWHWMDPEATQLEVARILRRGGTLGLMWNSADRSVDWVIEMLGPRSSLQGETPEEARGVRARRRGVPTGAPFQKGEEEMFQWSVELTVDDVVGLVGSYSRVITLPPEDASKVLERARKLAEERASAEGATTIQLPMACQTFRFVRD